MQKQSCKGKTGKNKLGTDDCRQQEKTHRKSEYNKVQLSCSADRAEY